MGIKGINMDSNKGDKIRLPIKEVFPRISTYQKTALNKLGIKNLGDLLYHFPSRYNNTAEMTTISSLKKGDEAIIYGKISELKAEKTFKKRMTLTRATLTDHTGKINCIWFNQPYISKMISENSIVRVEGKISETKQTASKKNTEPELYLSNPQIELTPNIPLGHHDSLFPDDSKKILYPVYPESRGISSNWLYHKVQKLFKEGILDELNDPIPQEILNKYNLPSLKTAMIWIHSPQKEDHANSARKRFAFEEIFLLQIEKQKARLEYSKNPAFVINTSEENIKSFIDRFPFRATNGQLSAIHSVVNDFRKGKPMSRLLEGDVGSGKTAVGATCAFSVVTTRPVGQKFGRLQVAYMCPTEILATEHFNSFIKYFSYLNIPVGLITGSGCKKFPSKLNPEGYTDISRTQLLKWVANGEIPILVGTHALIQKSVKFKNLALVIIDEQHRFGTEQRANLIRKDEDNKFRAPHLLSMTATPIPRTLALTIFGDLDLTVLDEMPAGRLPVITEIIPPQHREIIYKKISEELEKGRQMYIICPRIDEPDPEKALALNAKSVIEEAKRIKKDVFPQYEIGLLHGKMKPAEKDKAMNNFREGKTKILCATSVVEVGVNVPNATIIIIEGGERFGLAQLHQLRGRVMRSSLQPYCYIFSETMNKKTAERLRAFKNAKNGFELAEYDLQFRGAGDLYGNKQWGISDIAMDALKNIKMVELAREEAKKIIEIDPDLKNPQNEIIKEHLSDKKNRVHLE